MILETAFPPTWDKETYLKHRTSACSYPVHETQACGTFDALPNELAILLQFLRTDTLSFETLICPLQFGALDPL